MPDLNAATNTASAGTQSSFTVDPISAIANSFASVTASISNIFVKDKETEKAKVELEGAKQAVLVAKEETKRSNNQVTITALELAKAKEASLQKQVDDATAITKQKQSIGVITLTVVLVLVFGLAWLFVKFVLPIIFPKPEVQPQNVVIQDE
ncbi:MAG: hypothetical protein H7339_08810 [Arcicella sp.]|nr:hypothetical protein [Arcicella sp.]